MTVAFVGSCSASFFEPVLSAGDEDQLVAALGELPGELLADPGRRRR